MDIERKCQFCKFYKDGYCENLELKPCYPQKGCDDFSERNEVEVEVELELNMTKLIDEIKEVTQVFNELVDNLERIEKKYVEQENNDKCKNCEYYYNPNYTRCHECKAESEGV